MKGGNRRRKHDGGNYGASQTKGFNADKGGCNNYDTFTNEVPQREKWSCEQTEASNTIADQDQFNRSHQLFAILTLMV